MFARLSLLALLVLPWTCISSRVVPTPPAEVERLMWNPASLPWSTAIIWVERPTGITLTTGVLLDKEKRLVLATRHAVEKLGSVTETETVYIVWPEMAADGSLINTSDHYFQKRRNGTWQPAKVLKLDAARDVVLLEAPTAPPDQARAVPVQWDAPPVGQAVQGISQPFTRGALWHPFNATLQESISRRLTYAPEHLRQPVLLHVARGEHPFDFGYSGSPLVHPHTGHLVGLLLAAQLDQPHSYVLISGQELHQFLRIE